VYKAILCNGVTIEAGVVIGQGSIICEGVIIKAGTEIPEKSRISLFQHIEGNYVFSND
jgi:UDP-3-O-[3-hydroxymyristoyl] glucosamine N-acyltransferase